MPALETKILETKRLLLRRLTMDDLEALAVIYSDPDVRKYFPEGTLTYAETKEELEWIIDVYYGQYGFGLWATILKETGEFVGRCGLLPWKIDGHSEVEVAYLLAKAYWGQGLGSEAARAIRDYGFEHLDSTRLVGSSQNLVQGLQHADAQQSQVPPPVQVPLERLICLIHPGNQASIKVAQKIGMTFEKELEKDTLLYSVSRGAWLGPTR